VDSIKKLDLICNQKISLFVNHFHCNLLDRSTKWVGCCPIHQGDNKTAFNYYKTGYWKCRTRNCHDNFLGTPIGFVRGLLSRDQKEPVSFNDTIKFICKAIDTDFQSLPEIKVPEQAPIIRPLKQLNLNVQLLHKRLIIPCPYFSAKFNESVVYEKRIGLCDTRGKFFFKRSVIPILNRDNTEILACQGRSIHEKCNKCESYHEQGIQCPDYYYPKWKTSKNFATDMYFYNYWEAKKNIGKKKVLFITESVGNVLRFIEFDLRNIVATFGTQFSKYQKEMCENSGADIFVCIPDPGEAGQKIAKEIQKELGERCIIPDLGLKEPDDVASISKIDFDQKILKSIREWI